ncbi:MAG: hypothetical protein R3F30_08845 [Planctomycetota bacterium]
MKSVLAFAAVAALGLPLAAQTTLPQNQFYQYDYTIEYVTRGANQGNPGHVSQGLTPGQIRGIPDLSKILIHLQDWEISTLDPIDLMWTKLDAEGLPDYVNGNTVIISNVSLPTTGSGVAAYLVTYNLNTTASPPILVPATDEMLHFTWYLKDNPGAKWTATPTEGQSVAMSNDAGTPGGAGLQCILYSGRNYHQEIPRQEFDSTQTKYQIDEEMGWTSQPQGVPLTNQRAYRVEFASTIPVLSAQSDNIVFNNTPTGGTSSCPNPNRGYAALDPDFNNNDSNQTPGRFDNPSWHLEAGTGFASAPAVILWSQSMFTGPITVFGPTPLWVDITDPLFAFSPGLNGAPLVLNGLGVGDQSIPLSPNNVSGTALSAIAATFPSWHAQALVIAPSTSVQTQFTNVTSMRPLLVPGKFTADKIDATQTTLMVPRLYGTTKAQTMFVRNDGRGVLTIKQYFSNNGTGTEITGTAVNLSERCAYRIRLHPASNSMVVSSNRTFATSSTNVHNFVYQLDY